MHQANINQTYGACCNEMDIFESNSRAKTFVPHPCNITQVYKCEGEDECGQPVGVCDKWGCGFNEYKWGVEDFYGAGSDFKVDSSKKFTVTTQFLTDNGKEDGTLVEIRRLYHQEGKLIKNTAIQVEDNFSTDSVSTEFCEKTASFTMQRGGLKAMGEAIGRGMVLVFSIWADDSGFMNWLDAEGNGPCSATEGDPKEIVKNKPDARVTFSNIRWGEVGSTYAPGGKCGVKSRVARGITA